MSPAIEHAYVGLEPPELWRHFGALNALPRPSGREQRAREYVQGVADACGAAWQSDAAGNLRVSVGSVGVRAAGSAVAVQSHLDMVCDKDDGVDHDWSEDPITPRREGDRIFASGTTLGADNGIGVAAALALLTTPGLRHGPLELLFTVDEERGQHGAQALDLALVRAPFLVNLDSEESDELVIGSAGSQDTLVTLPIGREPVPATGYAARSIDVGGLRGGHSGLEIHERRANALKLLAQLLDAGRAAVADARLASLDGGIARNAIARMARASVVLAAGSEARWEAATSRVRDELQNMWGDDEPRLAIEIEEAPVPATALAPAAADALLSLLERLPHGVLAMHDGSTSEVKTSANLALAATQVDSAELLVMSRSLSEPDLRGVCTEIAATCAAAGATAERASGYPPWPPAPADSELVAATSAIYRRVNGRPARLVTLHAGLECGVIAARVPGLLAISFGPLIQGAHTPGEYVDASTVPAMWALLIGLLERLGQARSAG